MHCCAVRLSTPVLNSERLSYLTVGDICMTFKLPLWTIMAFGEVLSLSVYILVESDWFLQWVLFSCRAGYGEFITTKKLLWCYGQTGQRIGAATSFFIIWLYLQKLNEQLKYTYGIKFPIRPTAVVQVEECLATNPQNQSSNRTGAGGRSLFPSSKVAVFIIELEISMTRLLS